MIMLAKRPVWAYVAPPETFLLVWYTHKRSRDGQLNFTDVKIFLLRKWVGIAIVIAYFPL